MLDFPLNSRKKVYSLFAVTVNCSGNRCLDEKRCFLAQKLVYEDFWTFIGSTNSESK